MEVEVVVDELLVVALPAFQGFGNGFKFSVPLCGFSGGVLSSKNYIKLHKI